MNGKIIPNYTQRCNSYLKIRKVFDDILRALDNQFGRPFMMTNSTAAAKIDAEEAKPKVDLFRTVIAAIPRYSTTTY